MEITQKIDQGIIVGDTRHTGEPRENTVSSDRHASGPIRHKLRSRDQTLISDFGPGLFVPAGQAPDGGEERGKAKLVLGWSRWAGMLPPSTVRHSHPGVLGLVARPLVPVAMYFCKNIDVQIFFGT